MYVQMNGSYYIHFRRGNKAGFYGLSWFVEISNAKAAKRLRGYLIRLTREYTDGGMDSRAEEEKGVTQGLRDVYCQQRCQIHFQRKCSLRRPCIHGRGGRDICAPIAVFALKHEAIFQ
jgi:hypothetical protein